MPVMNFDLEDGLPPVSFTLKTDDAERFMDFMAECQAAKNSAQQAQTAPVEPQAQEPVAWDEAQRICDLPQVDDAIRNLLADQTGDNATCMVRAILEAAPVSAVNVPEGFSRDDLEAVADGLDTYEQTVNVGNNMGLGDEYLESTTAYAARFIRAMLSTAPSSPIAANSEDVPKFLLIAHGDPGDPACVTICDTEQERIEATKRSMFDNGDITGHEDEFAGTVQTLTEDRIVTFEGDPPLEWITAYIAATQQKKEE